MKFNSALNDPKSVDTPENKTTNQVCMCVNVCSLYIYIISKHHWTSTNIKRKNKYRDYKENYFWKENLITISQEPRLEKSQSKNWKKNNKLLINISTNNIVELNEVISAGAKLVCDKIAVPLKNKNRNSKPGWEIRQETQIRNLRKQAKMLKDPNKQLPTYQLKEKK